MDMDTALFNPVFSNPALPKPPVSLETLSQILPQTTLLGDGKLEVLDLVHPKLYQNPHELVLIIEPASLALLQSGKVKTALIAKEILDDLSDAAHPVKAGLLSGCLVSERPRHALAYLLNIFNKPPHIPARGIHPSAIVEASATVHPDAHVGAYCYIGENASVDAGTMLMPQVTIGAEARIGKNTLIYSGARIGERVLIGNQVVIHHNACIGPDGFSFVTPKKGSAEAAKEGKGSQGQTDTKNTELIRIHSIGSVVIEDDVEIGACTCIDRSTLGATLIKKGTKIDNLVQIGHNNTIGENCLIVSQVGIAGSCQIGDRVVIAGQAGFADHLKISDDAVITAKAGVMRDIEAGEVVAGIPAMPAREALKNVMLISKLSDMNKEMKDLKKRLAAIEAAAQTSAEKNDAELAKA